MEFHDILHKIVRSKYNGPKQLMFAIALSNTEHLRKQQQDAVSKSLHASTSGQQGSIQPRLNAGGSLRHKLVECLALLKFLGPQLLGFLSTAESSGSTIRLLDRMSGACENVASILRHSSTSSQSENSILLPDSRDSFEMLWDTLNIGDLALKPVDQTCHQSMKFQLLLRRFRTEIAYIISRQISNMSMLNFSDSDEAQAQDLSYIEKQNERCRLLLRIAGTEKASCEACISALCASVDEVRLFFFIIRS